MSQQSKHITLKCSVKGVGGTKRAKKLIQSLGQSVIELDIVEKDGPFSFGECIFKTVGEQLRCLRITCKSISKNSIMEMENVLCQLDELDISVENNEMQKNVYLPKFCNQVNRLRLNWNPSFGGGWTNLVNLYLGNNVVIYDLDQFVNFMINNQQLKELDFRAHCPAPLKHVAAWLSDLEKLTFHQRDHNLIASHILEFKNLSKLKMLELGNIKTQYFNDVFQNLSQLENLVELRVVQFGNSSGITLSLSGSNQRAMIALASTMKQLEVFGVSGLSILPTSIVEFVKNAIELRALHIHNCSKITFGSETLLTDIINIRKSRKRHRGPLLLCTDVGILNNVRKV